MADQPFMQFYGSDFVGDTLHLTTEQVGAYMLLLIAMWNAKGRLPNNPAKLARITRMTLPRWLKTAPELLPYFESDDDEIWHKRMLKSLQKLREKSAKNRENGAKGGIAKSLKNNDTTVANANETLERKPSIARATPEPELKERTSNDVQKKAASRGSRLPADWMPSEKDNAWLREKWPGISRAQVEHQLERFRNYWLSKSGKDATKVNWSLTWHNWMLTEMSRSAGATTSRARPRSEADVANEILAEMERAENGNGETPDGPNRAAYLALSDTKLRDA